MTAGPDDAPGTVLVVGAGLIGTSIGLALRGAAQVLLADADDRNVTDAVARGAGVRWDGRAPVDLAVACVPPSATAAVLADLHTRGAARRYTHVASVQSPVQAEAEALAPALAPRVCGGHPLSGRERRGPTAASGRLFVDRPWAVCPSAVTEEDVTATVTWLAQACGAVPLQLPPQDHDAAVALVSHLPQLTASALAAQLVPAGGSGSSRALALAGPGVQDTTRIAASDPVLWTEILRANAGQVAPLLRAMVDDLAAVADALDVLAAAPGDQPAADRLTRLLRRGNAGRAALPVKDRARELDLAQVAVDVPDAPGQLAAVLACAAEAGVNVEDVRVEHLTGRPRGVLELVVARTAEPTARAALARAGWDVVEA